MTDDPSFSTLKRPDEADLARFRFTGIKRNDDIRKYLTAGWSLAICCRNCPRIVEWTPPMLLEKFGDRPGLTIQKLFPHLACKGEGGCGSRDVVVFPHLYDHKWEWPPRLL